MADPALHPIEQTPLRVQVAERLRSAIVTGRLRPGDALTETALAEQLNVSRAPIREAIQDLENDGLVETVAYRGKRVKPLTVREVSEIREMRQHFEVMAVRRIVKLGIDVEALWTPCRAMEKAAAQIMSLRNDEEVDLLDIARAHPPIVEALASGDVECAVRLVSEHFDALADFDPAAIADPG